MICSKRPEHHIDKSNVGEKNDNDGDDDGDDDDDDDDDDYDGENDDDDHNDDSSMQGLLDAPCLICEQQNL